MKRIYYIGLAMVMQIMVIIVLLVVIRLTHQTLFLSCCRLLSSLFTLHLNLFFFSKILAAFPLLVKKRNTIHGYFFRYYVLAR